MLQKNVNFTADTGHANHVTQKESINGSPKNVVIVKNQKGNDEGGLCGWHTWMLNWFREQCSDGDFFNLALACFGLLLNLLVAAIDLDVKLVGGDGQRYPTAFQMTTYTG